MSDKELKFTDGRGIYKFDWKYYLDKYSDLINNGINNELKVLGHWINHGRKEKRFYCWEMDNVLSNKHFRNFMCSSKYFV